MSKYLFVIDYQKDFVDGALGFPGAEKLDAGIAAKVREYGQGHVICTRDTHFADYLETREGKSLPVVHCVKGTPGWALYGETAKICEEIGAPCIDKLSFGIDYGDPAVLAVLPEQAEEIELVGLVSYMCVLSNAIIAKAALPEAEILIDAACTAGPDQALHEKCLDLMESLQMTVINR